ncbi:MAG: hypothetical protein EBT30_09260 [Verrucomicrobia bacterium]|nr:hypothetical protein [Verrucomicrobiota bacterium]
MTESDEESRRALDKAAGVAEALSGAIPGSGTVWGLLLGPVAPAFGLVAAILKFLRGAVDDDEEARFFGVIQKGISHGDRIIVDLKRKGKEVFWSPEGVGPRKKRGMDEPTRCGVEPGPFG